MKTLIEYIKRDPAEALYVGVVIAVTIVTACVCYDEREMLLGLFK